MRRILLLFLCALISPSVAWAECSGSSPNLTAADASQTEVMACVSSATYGDTINVPSGTATWSATSQGCTGDSMLCMKKGVSLKGAGSSSTIITLSGTAVYGAICYEPDETSISNNNTFEITGFSFDSGGANYAGELSKLLFIRDVSEDDMVGHALVAFIEIKYQAKINASMDY